jgi:hypothetical protein
VPGVRGDRRHQGQRTASSFRLIRFGARVGIANGRE